MKTITKFLRLMCSKKGRDLISKLIDNAENIRELIEAVESRPETEKDENE